MNWWETDCIKSEFSKYGIELDYSRHFHVGDFWISFLNGKSSDDKYYILFYVYQDEYEHCMFECGNMHDLETFVSNIMGYQRYEEVAMYWEREYI